MDHCTDINSNGKLYSQINIVILIKQENQNFTPPAHNMALEKKIPEKKNTFIL